MFAYLPTFYATVGDDEMVHSAMSACALACFGGSTGQPIALQLARRHYGKALIIVRRALDIPEVIEKNSALLSLLLLSNFEAMTFIGQGPPVNWINHVHGLSTLLRLRCESQFDDVLGQKLFCHASIHVITHCLQHVIPVPDHVERLRKHASSVLHLNHFGLTFGGPLGDAVALRTSMKGRSTTGVVREALRIDREIVNIMMLELSNCEPQSSQTQDSRQMNAKFTINDLRRHNTLRMLRICFQEWIFSAFEPSPYGITLNRPSEDDDLYQIWRHLRANTVLEFAKLADEILLTVPFFTALDGPSPYLMTRFLLCPLVVAAASKLCSSTTREIILKVLDKISTGYNSILMQQVLSTIEHGQGFEIETW